MDYKHIQKGYNKIHISCLLYLQRILQLATHVLVQIHVHSWAFWRDTLQFSLRYVPDECSIGAKRLLAGAIWAIIPSHCTKSLLFIRWQLHSVFEMEATSRWIMLSTVYLRNGSLETRSAFANINRTADGSITHDRMYWPMKSKE